MDYKIENSPIAKITAECILMGIYEDGTLTAFGVEFDQIAGNIVSTLFNQGDIKSKLSEINYISYVPDCSIKRAVIVGLGKKEPLTNKKYRKILASAINFIKGTKLKSGLSALLDIDVVDMTETWKSRQLVEIFEDNCYQFTQTKSSKDDAYTFSTLQIQCPSDQNAEIEEGIKQGQAIASGVTLSKKLSDLPGNICTPSYLADQAKELAEQLPAIKVSVLEEKDMQKLGMGALLSVSRGSRQPAKLICLEYQGANKTSKPYALVGKGLTFDAGGISLKPGQAMDEMKYDMCGGASVLGTVYAVAKLQLPINVVGIIPSSENLPDGDANKPGDVVTSMSGKTIEILNTDAEGRLILCDALTYTKRFEPETVIDIATLTGACVIALGKHPSGLLSNDDDLCNDLTDASHMACDAVWRLPLWEEYQDQLKTNFADMANIGGREGGSITAGCFLSRYTEDFRWAHLDIAGTAWRSSGPLKGATGRPVPLLTQYLIDRAHANG